MLTIVNSNLLWKNSNGQKKLFLKTKGLENSFENKIIPCNPYTSKLVASLFNGLELFPIKFSSNVFINDDHSNHVLKQISEIISDGKIYTQNSIDRESKSFDNMEFIDDIRSFEKKHNDIDFVYLDYNESKKLIDTINVSKSILRQHGFIIIIINFEFNQYEILKKKYSKYYRAF